MTIDPTHYKASWASRLIAGILLLGALGTWPYSYFQLLRWVVTIAAVYSAWLFFNDKKQAWGWAFVAAAVLFNPIAPFKMERGNWLIFDIVAGLGFLGSLYITSDKDDE